jgi:hypothetical protein
MTKIEAPIAVRSLPSQANDLKKSNPIAVRMPLSNPLEGSNICAQRMPMTIAGMV